MKFFIQNNTNAKGYWIILSKTLRNIFLVGLTVNFFLGLFKQGYKDSEYKLIAAYFALGCGLLAFLLDIIHWLKPMWFENKKAE